MNLFRFARRDGISDGLENVIGPSTSLKGVIRSDGGARIEGRFEGHIEVAGNVVVGEEGIVVGDIIARDVTIGGTVDGNIEGAGRLEILSTGKVYGDITAAAVMIDEGGQFEGISRMHGAARPALQAPPEDDLILEMTRAAGATAEASGEGRQPEDRRGADGDGGDRPSEVDASQSSADDDIVIERPGKRRGRRDSAGDGEDAGRPEGDGRRRTKSARKRSQRAPSSSEGSNHAERAASGAEGDGFDGIDLNIEPVIPETAPPSSSASAE